MYAGKTSAKASKWQQQSSNTLSRKEHQLIGSTRIPCRAVEPMHSHYRTLKSKKWDDGRGPRSRNIFAKNSTASQRGWQRVWNKTSNLLTSQAEHTMTLQPNALNRITISTTWPLHRFFLTTPSGLGASIWMTQCFSLTDSRLTKIWEHMHFFDGIF